jgi:hypothetical protein
MLGAWGEALREEEGLHFKKVRGSGQFNIGDSLIKQSLNQITYPQKSGALTVWHMAA